MTSVEVPPSTASTQADAALRDPGRQFELLVNSVTDYAIYMLDPDGHVRTWNPGGQRIKGYLADEAIGLHFSRFYPEDDAGEGVPARNLETARRDGRYAGEGWRLRKDGTRFHASVVIDPIWEDGELLGYAKITRDITERYEAEQRLEQARQSLLEAQKMEAIGKLTMGLAHDFNNLLTIIVNTLDAIELRAGGAAGGDLLETALRASERGIILTRQLLAFGRGQDLAPERVDLNALVAGAEDLCRRCAGPGVTVEYALAPGLPQVCLDPAQFEAALLNLVGNSRDAMPDGGVVRIATEALLPGGAGRPLGGHVRVTVGDNGIGIPEALQARVFEPFFTTKDGGRGSGLGLSQVFGFASQSGGRVELHSAPGRGTRVAMDFPVAEAAP